MVGAEASQCQAGKEAELVSRVSVVAEAKGAAKTKAVQQRLPTLLALGVQRVTASQGAGATAGATARLLGRPTAPAPLPARQITAPTIGWLQFFV